jgi:hypothetical protein
MLRIAVETLGNWRSARKGPAFVKVGSRVRYPLPAIHEFIEQAKRNSPDSRHPLSQTQHAGVGA